MIYQLKRSVPITFSCKFFGVCRGHYYKWTKVDESISFSKKEDICKEIKKEFKSSKGTYGSPRIYRALKYKGIGISENTIAKYMKELGLDSRHLSS